MNFLLKLSRFFFCGVSLCLMLWGESFAEYQTPIDFEASYIRINFTPPDIPSTPSFSCLGTSTLPAQFSFEEFGLSVSGNVLEINNCFQQAGDYMVTVHLEDTGGQESDSLFNFSIKPTDPFLDNTETFRTTSVDHPVANNHDYYDLKIFLKDKFGNPVTEIKSIKVSSDSAFPQDANVEASFREGLRIEGQVLPAVIPEFPNITDNDSEDGIDFKVKSLVPSLGKLGSYLAQVKDFEVDFLLTFPSITSTGTLDNSQEQNLHYEVPLKFKPLFEVKPKFPEFVLDDHQMSLELQMTQNGQVETITPEYPESIRVFSPSSGIVFAQEEGLANLTEPGHTITSITTMPITLLTHLNGVINQALTIVTEASYYLGGLLVKYPAGFAGGLENPDLGIPPEDPILGEGNQGASSIVGGNIDPTSIGFIGVSTEGGVMSSNDRFILDLEDADFTVVSEKTREMAARPRAIMRSQILEAISGVIPLPVVCNSTSTSPVFVKFADLDWTETSLILVENCDVRITGTSPTLMPSGKNTLVIRNGNLLIDEDLKYTHPEDSFGFILFNDITIPYPAWGNVFIESNVSQIVGAFQLDGGIFGYKKEVDAQSFPKKPNSSILITAKNESEALIDLDFIANPRYETDFNSVRKQLVLRGSFMAHNTMGGHLIKDDDPLNSKKFYFTPWHKFDTTHASNIQSDWTDEKLALAYDLNYLRRYDPLEAEDPETGEPLYCSVLPEDSNQCDGNPNAFVVRNDYKVETLPPPGFESLSEIDLGH